MPIAEPMTALTDGLLGLVSFVLAILLWRRRQGHVSRAFWAAGLFASTSAAWFGAIYHGSFGSVSTSLSAFFWKMVVWSVGLIAFLIVTGSAHATLPRRVARILAILAGFQFLFYAVFMIRHDDFKYVVNNYSPALVILAVVHAIGYRRNPAAAKAIWGAIVVSMIAAAVQQSTFDLHRHFNHNDLYHLIQMFGQYLFYRGASVMLDVERTTVRVDLAAPAT
jgi:vacuolar-type H+-ATPase subunit I/STV1